jgi:hypothetical protein
LFGVVPLVLSVGVLDFVGDWDDAPPGSMVVAWAIILGALALSSTSTGDVVYRAAPPHMRLLFGLLMDAAAILAAQFLLSKIRKARAEHRAAAARAAAGQHEVLLSQDELDMVQAMRGGARIGVLPDTPAPPHPDQQRQLPPPARQDRQLPAGSGGQRGGRRHQREPVIEALPAPVEARARVLSAAHNRTLTDARIIALAESGMSATAAGLRVGKSDRHGRNVINAWQTGNGQGSPEPAQAGHTPAPDALQAAESR